MKKIFLILLFFGLQFAIFAQEDMPPGPSGPGGPGQMQPKERVKDLKTKLKLTDDQAAKIETIFTKDQKKMQSLFEKRDGGDFETMRKTMNALSDSTDTAINKLLTPEQKTKYKKITDDRKKEMENRPPPPPNE